MKYTYILFTIGAFGAYLTLPMTTTIVTGVLIAAIWAVVIKIRNRMKLLAASKRIEPVYIIGPDQNGEHPDMAHLSDICVFAKLRSTGKEAGKWRDLLIESNNKQNLEVVEFRYQDGEYVNETPQEYENRVWQEIKDHRSKHHTKLKESNNEWYVKYHHKEKKTRVTTKPVNG